MNTHLIYLVAAAGAAVAPPAVAQVALNGGQRLFVFDVGSGKKGEAAYVEYTVPNLKTAEYTGYFSFTTHFDVANQTMYFANQGNMYSLAKSSGMKTPTLLFGAPNAKDLTLDSKKNIYVTDYADNSVDEYKPEPVQGGGTKTPFRVISLAPNQANYTVVDHQDNVWVALSDSTIAVYGPKGQAPIATFNIMSFIMDIKVDGAGTVWVLTNGFEPYPFTHCTPDPNGTIKRSPLIYSYVNLQMSSTLYSHEDDTNSIGHLAVADNGRVYYSAGNEILDYDPGTQCPNDSLTVTKLSTYAEAPLVLDAQSNLYASDTANASIYAYAPGSTKPFNVIRQKVASQGVELKVQ